MGYLHTPILRITAVTIIALCVVASGCSKPAETGAATHVNGAVQAESVSRLGGSAALHNIAADVATIVDNSQQPATNSRANILAVTCDASDTGLNLHAPDDWLVLDRSITHSRNKQQTEPGNQSDCKAAMVYLLNTFGSFQFAL